MSSGAKDYELVGNQIISGLVDLVDFDGNIRFDEKPWNSSR